jgi:Holliday junction DNA helicase RuvA
MLSFLRGTILLKAEDHLLVDVHDLGYRIYVTKTCISETKKDEKIELFLYQHIREDASDLYGFKNEDELELFEKLISVSGVGPKSGLAILSLAPSDSIRQAIAQGDDGMLTKVSGIGGKTAQRIILELRGKLDHIGSQGSGRSEEIEALVSLGYSSMQAREALNRIDSSITDSSERIRQALQHI